MIMNALRWVDALVGNNKWKIMLILAACMFGWGGYVFAQDLRFTQGKNSLTLHDAKCADPKVLGHINDAYHEKSKSATLVYEGKAYSACWAEIGGVVYFMDEVGDPGQLPREAFREVLGA